MYDIYLHTIYTREKVHSLVVRKQLLGGKLKIQTLLKYRFLSKIKLCPSIEIEWSLDFRAIMYGCWKLVEKAVERKSADAS